MRRRKSSSSTDENFSVNSNHPSLSLQSCVDDIPFHFNPKYRIIHLPNIDVEEFDTKSIRDILSTTVDFTLENKVLLEALEDVKRKKREIETDNLHQSLTKPSSITTNTNGHLSDSTPIGTQLPLEKTVHSQSHALSPPPPPPPSIQASLSLTYPHHSSSNPILSQPPSLAQPAPTTIATTFPSFIGASTNPSSIYSTSPSFRLPSVRDIYWPTANQQQYSIPNQTRLPTASNVVSYPSPFPLNPSLTPTAKPSPSPTPQSIPFSTTSTSVMMTTATTTGNNLLKPTNRSMNNGNSMFTNELARTFDGTLTSDDPFNDAELKSLNDVAELNHLYSALGSANTVRR